MLSMDHRKRSINGGGGGSHKLFSTQLEKELAEFEGRGSKTPRNYLPGKSNFPKVLLTSNPLVERDLQKKLSHINYGKSRRQKVWEWNQRHFLVNQIFDPEYNLRFTKGLVKYSNDDEFKGSGDNGRKISYNSSPGINDKQVAGGLGVFMPALHPSQRLIEKQKIPQSKLTNGMSTMNLANKKNNDNKNKRKTSETDDPFDENDDVSRRFSRGKPYQDNLLHRQSTTIGVGMTSSKNGRASLALATGKLSNNRKVSKSVSLPEIPLYKSKTDYEIQPFGRRTFDSNSDKESYVMLPDDNNSNDKEILCHEEVLDGITRSLPLSVMIKANQNINKQVQKRKAKMIEKCKSERDKDAFSDPRWIELSKVLVSQSTETE